MVEVAALCKDCPIESMVKQISDVLPNARVMAIQQVVKSRMEALAQLKKFSYGISGIILLIGSLVVMVTMMGSVRERTKEIGIFRAIGYRKGHIMRIVFTEAAIVSGLAGIIGYWLGLVPHMELPLVLALFLKPMILAIEVMGLCIKHSVLAVRLLANMFAGHLVLAVLIAFIGATAESFIVLWAGVTFASVCGAAALSLLELFVAFLQAYIFAFLSALFIGMAVHQH